MGGGGGYPLRSQADSVLKRPGEIGLKNSPGGWSGIELTDT